MKDCLRFIVCLTRSPLAQKVTCGVFVSLVAVEIAVFIPSYYNRQREYLEQLTEVSQELLWATDQQALGNHSGEQAFQALEQKWNPSSVIEGAALYRLPQSESPDRPLPLASLSPSPNPSGDRGIRVQQFGDAPPLFAQPTRPSQPQTFLDRRTYRYDVATLSPTSAPGDPYVIVVRHDASGLPADLWNYGLRVVGLVVVIATVVTGTTMVVVGQLVIEPVLKLRRDFLQVGSIVTQPSPDSHIALETHGIQQSDEMGDVARSFQDLFLQTCHAIQARAQTEQALREAQLKSEQLLQNILPACIADRLKQNEQAIAENFDQVTILFADLVNFTCLSTQMPASELVCLLNDIFSRFDTLVEGYGLEKIKTIGDAYMVVGGVPLPHDRPAAAMVDLALDLRSALAEFNQERHRNFQLRMGINTGAVVAGVIGLKKFSYDLWGDAVNIASRMESHGIPDKIQISAATYALVGDQYPFEYRGKIPIKGRGEMETYLL